MSALLDRLYRRDPTPRFWRFGQAVTLVGGALALTYALDAPSAFLAYLLGILGCLWGLDVFLAFLYLITEDL